MLLTQVVFDKLGRPIENRQYETGSNYIATQTQYDALGRAYKVSNGFRPWQSESAVWTTQLFDALGRITPAGVLTENFFFAGGPAPTGLAAGPSGSHTLWFLGYGNDRVYAMVAP